MIKAKKIEIVFENGICVAKVNIGDGRFLVSDTVANANTVKDAIKMMKNVLENVERIMGDRSIADITKDRYEVRDVVCDYGIFERGNLKLITNSRANALLIKEILEVDSTEKVWRR